MQRVLSAKLTQIVKGLVSDVDTYDESRTCDILRYFNTLIFVSNFTHPHGYTLHGYIGQIDLTRSLYESISSDNAHVPAISYRLVLYVFK